MINNKDIYTLWESNSVLSTSEKVKLFNKTYGTNFGARALQQRYKNFKDGFEMGVQESGVDTQLETLAKKRLNIMKEQKITMYMKRELHKQSRENAIKDLIVKEIEKDFVVPKIKVRKTKLYHSKELIEFIIADIQYKGGKKEQEWVNLIFDTMVSNIGKINKDAEYRVVFLGDEIEGNSAHQSQLLEVTKTAINQVRELTSLLVQGLNDFFSRLGDVNKSLVFVPYSNHGLGFGLGKARYQFLDDDFGLIIFDSLKLGLNGDIHIFEPDHIRMVVETPQSIYYHGHLGYNKNKNRENEVLGVDKDLDGGHLHHYEEKEERNRVRTLFPTCRRKNYNDEIIVGRYEDFAGFKPTPQITKRIRGNGYRIVERYEIKEHYE